MCTFTAASMTSHMVVQLAHGSGPRGPYIGGLAVDQCQVGWQQPTPGIYRSPGIYGPCALAMQGIDLDM